MSLIFRSFFFLCVLVPICESFTLHRPQLLLSSSPACGSQGYDVSSDDMILRRVDKWACVKNCGACCKLGPIESRPDLETYLSAEEHQLYKSMIGHDNWCKNFDKNTRMCKIYDERPSFCRVDPVKFKSMYIVEEAELNDFCTFCCREQIADVYGDESKEMFNFEKVIDSLEENNGSAYDIIDSLEANQI